MDFEPLGSDVDDLALKLVSDVHTVLSALLRPILIAQDPAVCILFTTRSGVSIVDEF